MLASLVAVAALQSSKAWLDSHLVPLSSAGQFARYDDLQALKLMLKDVRIVGMGEATHGTREFFETKHRMFRFLVEEMGYRVFILEASMPACLEMDEFVTTGKGDVKRAVSRQRFWTWDTVELRDLILWMRDYNNTHEDKLRVIGNDMQDEEGPLAFLESIDLELGKVMPKRDFSLNQDSSEGRAAREAIVRRAYEKLSPERARLVEALKINLEQAIGNNWYQGLVAIQQRVVPQMKTIFPDAEKLMSEAKNLTTLQIEALKFVDEHKAKLVEEKYTTPEGAKLMNSYWYAMRDAGTQHPALKARFSAQGELFEFLAYVGLMPKGKGDPFDYRDACMAANSSWIVKKLYPGSKAMIWAHNGHVGRFQFSKSRATMGWYLAEEWKDKYSPFGFAFSQGSFRAIHDEGSLQVHKVRPSSANLDQFFAGARVADFFVGLKGSEGLPTELSGKAKSRSIGALYDPTNDDAYQLEMIAKDTFDGMFFFKKTSASRPNR